MKSITVILSGIVIALSLIACDNNDNDDNDGFVDAVVNEITDNTSDSTEPRSLADFPAPDADDTNDSAEPRPLPTS